MRWGKCKSRASANCFLIESGAIRERMDAKRQSVSEGRGVVAYCPLVEVRTRISTRERHSTMTGC